MMASDMPPSIRIEPALLCVTPCFCTSSYRPDVIGSAQELLEEGLLPQQLVPVPEPGCPLMIGEINGRMALCREAAVRTGARELHVVSNGSETLLYLKGLREPPVVYWTIVWVRALFKDRKHDQQTK